MTQAAHISVMPDEVIQALNLPSGAVVFDGTLGLAGHALLLAQLVGPQGRLIGCDQDPASLEEGRQRLSALDLKIDLVQSNFKDIKRILSDLDVPAVDGVLLDLGISSFQLDNPERGFAFKNPGPLDMRMDQSQGTSAADFINKAPEAEIAQVIFEYGEERFARRIAKFIIEERSRAKIVSTEQLSHIILKSLPKGYQRGRIHPATRTFQALRIAVNKELEILPGALEACFDALKINGRMCVISFHSLEDRIVKNTFRRLDQEERGLILTKKPLEASDEECTINPRSRSAKLRAIQRTA
jgi:16S rRNA (cytosine1402-N4)-methyltransferase